MRVRYLLLALALGLNGCGSAGPSSTTPPPSARVSGVAATPSASLDAEAIRKAAGAAYLTAANSALTAQHAFDKKYPSNMTLRQARSYYSGHAKIEGAFIDAIKKLVVPADTAGDLHTLIVRETALQALDLTLARAKSIGVLDARSSELAKAVDAATAAANQVRSDLDLPPVQF